MKKNKNLWLSFAAPLLILLAMIGFFQRKGNERAQSIPALLIGSGLILTSLVGHQLKRKKLLNDLQKINEEDN